MSRYMCVLCCLLSVSCSRAPQREVASRPILAPPNDNVTADEPVVASPIRHANLIIFPITSLQPKCEDRFTTLDEGLRAGTVEVFEMGASSIISAAEAAQVNQSTSVEDPFGSVTTQGDPFADPFANSRPTNDPPEAASSSDELLMHELTGPEVNQVLVINRSSKPLYLMPGEIIMGGDQDRCVAEEFVLQPSDQPTAIDAFCVEHGRWGARAPAATTQFVGAALAFSESVSLAPEVDSVAIAQAANEGKFVASVGSLNKTARLAVQASKDQATVWSSVADVNADTGIDVSSGAFTGNYVDGASLSRLGPYHDAFHDKVLAVENIIGVVVAINGEIHTMDVFESTPLFTKLWPKLLKSYALDAANLADKDDAQKLCTQEAARAFVYESMHANLDESDVIRGVAITRRSSDELISFSADADSLGGGGFGGGGGLAEVVDWRRWWIRWRSYICLFEVTTVLSRCG